MKKLFIILAAALMCCTVACKKDDNSNDNAIPPVDYSKAILGKWKEVSANGMVIPTNLRIIMTLTPNCLMTSSAGLTPDGLMVWNNQIPYSYQMNGTLLMFMDTTYKVNISTNIAKLDDSLLLFNSYVMEPVNGETPITVNNVLFQKVTVDYAQPIIGLWEGVSAEGDTTYGNYNHRWEFRADGTFTYYSQDASGNWVPDQSNALNKYNVDGDWLAFHWVKNGEDNFEWWDITECDGNNMTWHAIRQTGAGLLETDTRFETTFKMRKVQ